MTNSASGSNYSLSKIFWGAWLLFFGLALLYYLRSNEPIRRAALHMQPLVISLGFILSICGTGYPITRLLLPLQDRWIQLLTSLAFGIGLTGILSFGLGMIAQFDSVIFLLWFVIGLALFVLAMVRWRPQIERPVEWNVWNTVGVGIFMLFLGQSIPFVTAPEISNDALAYHLLIPKLYLSRGMVYHINLMVAAYYPSLAEYNYLPLLMLSDEIVCKCFHFWIALALLLTMARVVKKVNPDVNTILAPALFLAMPVTAIYMGWAWNDFLYTFFVLLWVYFLLNYHLTPPDDRSRRDLLIAGIMAGLASWTKYTFVLYFFGTVVLFLWGWLRWKWNPKHLWIFFLGIGFAAPFWLLQNWIFTYNPFYPFLNGIFHSPYWNEVSNQHFMHGLREYEISGWSWTRYLLAPLHVTLTPRLIDTHTGILPLVFVPLLFFRNQSRGLSLLKAFTGFCVLVWLLIHTENRSLLSVFAVLFCAASIALQEIRWPHNWWRVSFVTLILAAVASNLFMTYLTTYYLFDPLRYFLGRESKESYISRLGPSQVAFDYLNTNHVGRVLLVSIHHPYYLNKPHFFSSFSDPPIAELLTAGSRTPEDIANKFRSLNITHVALNRSWYEREHQDHLYSWTQQHRKLFEEFLFKFCKPVVRSANDFVFLVPAEK